MHGIDVLPTMRPDLFDRFDCSALEEIDLETVTTNRAPDIICHLAGSAFVAASIDNPMADFNSSVPGTAKLLAWNGRSRVRARVLNFSSAAVYGQPKRLPISERTSLRPISPYGIHKATNELLIEHYSRIFDFETINLRPFSVYGPKLKRQVVYDVAQKASAAMDARLDHFELWGTGRESRDFIFIDDLAYISLKICDIPLERQSITLNVASGIETTVASLASQIVHALGFPVTPVFSSISRRGDPEQWRADISALQSMIEYSPISLQRGLLEFSHWYLENHRR